MPATGVAERHQREEEHGVEDREHDPVHEVQRLPGEERSGRRGEDRVEGTGRGRSVETIGERGTEDAVVQRPRQRRQADRREHVTEVRAELRRDHADEHDATDAMADRPSCTTTGRSRRALSSRAASRIVARPADDGVGDDSHQSEPPLPEVGPPTDQRADYHTADIQLGDPVRRGGSRCCGRRSGRCPCRSGSRCSSAR